MLFLDWSSLCALESTESSYIGQSYPDANIIKIPKWEKYYKSWNEEVFCYCLLEMCTQNLQQNTWAIQAQESYCKAVYSETRGIYPGIMQLV